MTHFPEAGTTIVNNVAEPVLCSFQFLSFLVRKWSQKLCDIQKTEAALQGAQWPGPLLRPTGETVAGKSPFRPQGAIIRSADDLIPRTERKK